MATQHMAKAQFQSGFRSLSGQANITRDNPLTSSDACRVLDDLRGEINRGNLGKDVREGAERAIDHIKSRIRSNASFGITGRGFGQNLFSEQFSVGGRTYRVDFELSGEIKG